MIALRKRPHICLFVCVYRVHMVAIIKLVSRMGNRPTIADWQRKCKTFLK